MLKRGQFIVIFVFLSSIATATDIYVAKDGSGDYSNIQAAVNVAGPGDNIYVRAGNYPENIQFTSSGTSGNYITLQAYGVDYVSLDPGSIDGSDVSYVKVIGFHVLNPPSNNPGFDWRGSGSHIEIRDNEVAYTDNGNQAAIRFGGYLTDFIIDGNHIHDCRTGSQEALRVHQHTSDFEITNNIVNDNTNIGIDVVGWEQYGKPVRGLIAHNLAYDNSITAPYSAGIYVDCGSYITIEHNIAYGNRRGFQIGCEPNGDVTEGNIMRYNIAYDNDQAGLVMGGYQGGITKNNEIYNNVFYNNDEIEVSFDSTPGYDNVFYNNIFYSPGKSMIRASGVSPNIWDHNLFYDSGAVGTNNVVADPQFINPTDDFHVQGTSPACGAGRDGADIGVFSCGPVPPCTDGLTRPCTTGQQGICSEGTETCSGSSWSSCVPDNSPTAESCSNSLDDDCDGSVDCSDTDCSLDSACQSQPADKFRFISWADAKTWSELRILSQLSDQAVEQNAVFTIFPGDLVNSVSTSTLDGWREALDGELTGSSSSNGFFEKTFVVRGNHDMGNFGTWQNFFDMENVKNNVGAENLRQKSGYEDATYSFDYGNSHIIGLDCPGGEAYDMGLEMIEWLDEDLELAEERGLTHAFIFFHPPIFCIAPEGHCYCSNKNNYQGLCDENDVIRGIIEVINKHPIVTATFHGHEHTQGYTYLDNSRISFLSEPFHQFVTGSGGAGVYPCSDARVDYCMVDYGYVTLDVDGLNVEANWYRLDSNSVQHTESFSKTTDCGNGNCDSGETCVLDNCCNGVEYSANQVCCLGTVYLGDCCEDSDCTAPAACDNHVCLVPSLTCQGEGYKCCFSCSLGPHTEYDDDCNAQVCCEECNFHPADTNENGCIDVDEMLDFIGEWRKGIVSMPELMGAIGLWKEGC